MKIMKSVFAGVLFLLLAMAVPAFAQQEEHQEGKPDNPKTEARPAQPDRATPAEKKDEARPAQEPQRQEEERRTQEQQQEHRQQDATRTQEEQKNQQREHSGDMRNDERREQQQTAHRDNDRSGGKQHVRIPDDRFRSNFGREHHFHIESRPVIVEGVPRFQYGGYWFEMAQPWPTDWVYTDDYYIDYVDGDYYMYDPRFPSARILVYVIEL